MKGATITGKRDYGNKEMERVAEKGCRVRFSASSRMPAYNLVDGADMDLVVSEAKSIGIEPDYLRFNSSGANGTSYDPTDDIVDIKGDVFPRLTEAHPRARMSIRAVLAHEFYGHRPNRAQYLWELENNIPFELDEWQDEFRASYNASKADIDLSVADRACLHDDAISRAEEKQAYGKLEKLLKELDIYERNWKKRMRT